MGWFRRKKKQETVEPPPVAPVAWAPHGSGPVPQPQYPPQAPMPAQPPYPPQQYPAEQYPPQPYPPQPYLAQQYPAQPAGPAPYPPQAPLATPPSAVPVAEEPWPPPRAPQVEPPLPPGVPDVKFERFRHGVPHVEVSTSDGGCLVITPAHPLFEEFVRWGSAWSADADEPRVFRVHPENMRIRGVKRPPRGRVRRTS